MITCSDVFSSSVVVEILFHNFCIFPQLLTAPRDNHNSHLGPAIEGSDKSLLFDELIGGVRFDLIEVLSVSMIEITLSLPSCHQFLASSSL